MGQIDLIVAVGFVAAIVLCLAWVWVTRYKPPVDPFKKFDNAPCHCIHPVKCDTFDRCMKNEHS
jgi:hypothetical protein